MNKTLIKGFSAGVLMMFLLTMVTVCFAQDPFTKLGRGVANTLTGWVELPKNIYKTNVDENAFAGLTLGVAKGAGMTIVRTGAG
ncbi:MAG: exosortase system-associated protein, TIGR04073 family, partial [Candidatus Omnitrophica bacterium CG07_land_8_20_14_0_80_50_8]